MVKTPLPPRPDRLASSAIRDLLALTQRSDVLSLAGGLPHPSAVPTEAIAAATAEILATDGDAALAYGPTEGHGPLREWIGGRTAMSADGVLVTAGSQQALDLVVRTLAWPGAAIAVADPAYVGALQVIAASGARAVPIPADADGLRTDVLADLLAGGLRLTAAYVVAGTDNPTGATLTEERRRHLVELADRHGFWIVDDDAYGELRWSGPAPAPLRTRTDRVLTLGSASKVLSPGLRVGWVTGPDELIAELAIAKQAADLHTGSLTQRVVARVVADEAAFAAHLEGLRARRRHVRVGRPGPRRRPRPHHRRAARRRRGRGGRVRAGPGLRGGRSRRARPVAAPELRHRRSRRAARGRRPPGRGAQGLTALGTPRPRPR